MAPRNRKWRHQKTNDGNVFKTQYQPTNLKTDDGFPVPSEKALFYPPGNMAFKSIFCFRIVSAIWLHVTDCDETYNYWEPSHYLLFDTGFQTWEYSPQFALRSYLYLLIHVFPAWLYYQVFHPNRLLLFYFVRCFLAIICTFTEVYFYKSVCREFGVNVGRILLVVLMFSPGMFIASTAYLPSSFSITYIAVLMHGVDPSLLESNLQRCYYLWYNWNHSYRYLTMLSFAAWYGRNYPVAIICTALSTFVSWPFASIIGIPIAYEMVIIKRQFYRFFKWSIVSAAVIIGFLMEVDTSYYGKFTIAPLNIVNYNVFSSHGPNLYGVEPWYFYILNGFLNFNIGFILALLTPVLLFWSKTILSIDRRNAKCIPYCLSLFSAYLWLFVFILQPHKEERFLFPIYPLIALCAAVSIDCIQRLWFQYITKRGIHYSKDALKICAAILFVFATLGISRMLVLYKAYHAPTSTFIELTKVDHTLKGKFDVNLCIGKEWYRFPSSFHLPDRWKLHFIKSEFDGLLPAPFLSVPNATQISRTDMNDLNQEELSRYANIDICDFLIDSDSNSPTELEPIYSQHRNWTIVSSIPFLDAIRTPRLLRSFYIPFIWESGCNFLPYNLLRRSKPHPKFDAN